MRTCGRVPWGVRAPGCGGEGCYLRDWGKYRPVGSAGVVDLDPRLERESAGKGAVAGNACRELKERRAPK